MTTARKRGSKYQVQIRKEGSKGTFRSFTLHAEVKKRVRLMESKADTGQLDDFSEAN